MAGKNRGTLIIVGKEDISSVLSIRLEREGLSLSTVRDERAALETIRLGKASMMLLEVDEPDDKGLELLRKAKNLDSQLPVVVIAPREGYRGIVEAMKEGAYHYLVKPWDRQELIQVILRALEEQGRRARLKEELSGSLSGDRSLGEIMGSSEAVARLVSEVKCVAGSDLSVLIIGESGSGKEVIARAIHQASARSDAPFVPVDCGAIPETLLESELFGHEKGVFTDAKHHRIGKFELAEGGTVLLDEIFNMPLNSQVKLLRVLQEKKIYRVGGIKPLSVNVRILATSNRDIHDLAMSGTFRQDLFYRLSEFTITVPALRERKEDILYLAKRFLESANLELGKQIKGYSEAALHLLLSNTWPGNVRQLRSVIRRASLLADEMITEKDLEIRKSKPRELNSGGQMEGRPWESFPLRAFVQQKAAMVEREVLLLALRATRGNKAEAARLLRVGYKSMHDKMKKLGIQALQCEGG